MILLRGVQILTKNFSNKLTFNYFIVLEKRFDGYDSE